VPYNGDACQRPPISPTPYHSAPNRGRGEGEGTTHQKQREASASGMAHSDDPLGVSQDAALSFQQPGELSPAPRERILGICDGAIEDRDLWTEAVVGDHDDEAQAGQGVDLRLGHHVLGPDHEAAAVEDYDCGGISPWGGYIGSGFLFFFPS
jgi:hypothetical protein